MYKIADNIFYVGAGFSNSYLIQGEKNTLVGTVKKDFVNDFLSNVREIMPVSDIDYLICNHIEPDDSDAIQKIIEENAEIEIITTATASRNLKEILNKAFNGHIAKDGATLPLSKDRTLKFLVTPNLPWPDTMVTYICEDKILFTGELFCTENDLKKHDGEETQESDIKMFFDRQFSNVKLFIETAIQKISSLPINMILPSRGNVEKQYVNNLIDKYAKWSRCGERDGKTAAVFYDSVYGYTKKMAERICAVLIKCGIDVICYNVHNGYGKDEIYALNFADALVFGTPTINRNASKNIWKLISELDLIKRRGTPCFVFGAYGWGGEGTQYVHKHLSVIKMKPFDKPFGVIFNPSEEKLLQLDEYTKRFAQSL